MRRVTTETSQTQAFNAMANFHHADLSEHWVPRSRRRSAIQRVGRPFDSSLSLDDNLKLAGMDRPIELLPAPIQMPDGTLVATKNKHIVLTEPGKAGKDDKQVSLGVVAGKYRPLQTPDFLRNFDFLFDKFPPYALVSTGGGRQHGVVLRPQDLPKATKLNEDMEVGYMLLNDRTGKGGISIRPIIQRLVCTNGMVAMHAGKQSVLRMPHTERGLMEMERRKQLMHDLSVEPGEVLKTYELLVQRQVSVAQVQKVVEQIHVMPKKPVQLIRPDKYTGDERQAAQASYEATMSRINQQRSVVLALNEYENDTASSHLRGTAWLAWQAIVEEADYNHHGGQPTSTTGMWLGAAATEQEKGFKLLLEVR
jgi:hypothetical protein